MVFHVRDTVSTFFFPEQLCLLFIPSMVFATVITEVFSTNLPGHVLVESTMMDDARFPQEIHGTTVCFLWPLWVRGSISHGNVNSLLGITGECCLTSIGRDETKPDEMR